MRVSESRIAAVRKTVTPEAPATAADVTLAARLPAIDRDRTDNLSVGIAALLADEDLVASFTANATAIDAEGGGVVAEMLARVPGYLARHEAHARLLASVARIRASLEKDKIDFARFVDTAVKVCEEAGELKPRSRRSIAGWR